MLYYLHTKKKLITLKHTYFQDDLKFDYSPKRIPFSKLVYIIKSGQEEYIKNIESSTEEVLKK